MSRIAISGAVALLLGGACWLAGTASPARSQDTLLADVYGQGVHAYNGGAYQTAVEHLSTAINSGSRDPRAYYFRGLAYARLGYPDQAAVDFQAGAELEAKNQGEAFYPVSTSLQRIQGRERLTLEAYRNVARLKVRQEELARRRQRYEEIQSARPSVSRGGTSPAAGAAAPAPGAASGPFDAGARLGAGPASDAPARAAAGAAGPADEAFGTEPPATAPPTPPVDPFGEEPAEPAAPATPPAESDDPFAPMPEATPPAETPPASDDPFADDPAPGAEPPPAETPAEEPAAEEPAAEEPAAEEPAAETPPAEEPAADDDPFN